MKFSHLLSSLSIDSQEGHTEAVSEANSTCYYSQKKMAILTLLRVSHAVAAERNHVSPTPETRYMCMYIVWGVSRETRVHVVCVL